MISEFMLNSLTREQSYDFTSCNLSYLPGVCSMSPQGRLIKEIPAPRRLMPTAVKIPILGPRLLPTKSAWAPHSCSMDAKTSKGLRSLPGRARLK